MGRRAKKNVDYFPHLIADGKKMFYMERKYGNDGYATWFKILEILAKTDNHWINLNEQTELMYVSSKCLVEEETLINILDDLAILGQINQELWKVKVVWSDKFTDSVEDAYLKRNNKCWSLRDLREHLFSLGILKGSRKPQSKVKEIKEKETKEDTLVFPFNSDIFKSQWVVWKDYKKKEFKFSFKSVGSEQVSLKKLNDLAGNDEAKAIGIIEQSMANGWKGFFELKEKVPAGGGGFPHFYDNKFERTLQGQAVIDYHKHLKNLGWQKLHGPGGTTWKKP